MDKFDNTEFDANGNLKRIYDQESLLDVLIEFEGTLDSLDMYAFANWIDGEIVSGPHLSRYWISITLKYDFKKMPDPRGGQRLLKHGAKVEYVKTTEKVVIDVTEVEPADRDQEYEYDEERGKPVRKKKDVSIWLVKVSIPRRFIEDMEKGTIHIEDEDEIVDLAAADEAEAEGLDDESIMNNDVDIDKEEGDDF